MRRRHRMGSLVVACGLAGGSVAGADVSEVADHASQRAELVVAIGARDVAAVEASARLPLRVTGLWFDTPACRELAGAVDADELPVLVTCLAELGVHPA